MQHLGGVSWRAPSKDGVRLGEGDLADFGAGGSLERDDFEAARDRGRRQYSATDKS